MEVEKFQRRMNVIRIRQAYNMDKSVIYTVSQKNSGSLSSLT